MKNPRFPIQISLRLICLGPQRRLLVLFNFAALHVSFWTKKNTSSHSYLLVQLKVLSWPSLWLAHSRRLVPTSPKTWSYSVPPRSLHSRLPSRSLNVIPACPRLHSSPPCPVGARMAPRKCRVECIALSPSFPMVTSVMQRAYGCSYWTPTFTPFRWRHPSYVGVLFIVWIPLRGNNKS